MRVAKLTAIWFVGTVCLLEAVLQLGAAALWWFTPPPQAAVKEADSVALCVGDSFTFGLGTTSSHQSYPRQLERELRSRSGSDWRVVACARPGRNSREVLERIDAQLEAFHPDIVFVLVGLNDLWSHPRHLDLEHTPEERVSITKDYRFRLKWRTARLVDWAIGKLAPSSSAIDPTHDVQWRIAEDLRRGQPEVALSRIRALRLELRDNPNPATAAALVTALAATGNGDECLKSARTAIKEYPSHAVLWYHYAWESFQKGDDETATRAIEKAVEFFDVQSPEWQRRVLRGRAVIWREVDPDRSLRAAIDLFVTEGDKSNFRAIAAHPRHPDPQELLNRVLSQTDLDSTQSALIRVLFDEAQDPDLSDSVTTLSSHLVQIVKRCRAAGATPVLLTYPTNVESVEQSVRQIGDQLSVKRVHLWQAFQDRLRGDNRGDFFVPDGHCSDRGYGLIAEILANSTLGREHR